MRLSLGGARGEAPPLTFLLHTTGYAKSRKDGSKNGDCHFEDKFQGFVHSYKLGFKVILEPPPAPPKEGRRGDRIFMGEHVMLGKQFLILI